MKHTYPLGNIIKNVRAFLIAMLLAVSASAWGQAWNMVHGDTVHINACHQTNGIIYDDGGANGNYSDGFTGWVVIEAETGVSITLEGWYQLEGCCDYITVWDGNPTTGTQLWYRSGEGTMSLTATSGRMTLRFTSDGSVTYSGFALTVGHVGIPSSCASNITNLAASNITTTGATLSWSSPSSSLYLDYGRGVQSVGGSSTTLTGLNPNTLYNVRMYGAGEQNSPCCIATTSFRTACGVMAAPLEERFDDLTTGEMPPCWERAENFDATEYFAKVSTSAARSGNKSLAISSGDNNTGGHFALVMGPKMNETISALRMHFSSRANMGGAQIEVGVCDSTSSFYNYYGFTPLDTIYITNSGTWYEHEVDLSSYSGIGCRVAFRMIQSMQPGAGCIIFIDDLMVENCGVDGLAVSRRGMEDMTLSWSLIGTPTVDLLVSGGGETRAVSNVTSPYHITNLQPNTYYTLTLTPQCGTAYGSPKIVTGYTLPADTAQMAYCQDFEASWPSNWFRPEMYGSCPQRYNYNSQTMQMRSEYGNMSTVVLPYSAVAINQLSISLQMRTDYSGDGIVIGAMDYPLDTATFTPIDTIISSNTDWVYYTRDLSAYSGTGRYLAIRTKPQDTYNRYLYIDNIRIGRCLLSGLQASRRRGSSITLSWIASAGDATDSVVIEYGAEGFTLGSGTRVAVLPQNQCTAASGRWSYTITGLQAGTTYQFVAYRKCGDNVCSPDRVTTSTLQHEYTVPYCESFDGVQGDNYVYLPDWGRPMMHNNKPCLWQYGVGEAPSGSRALDMFACGPLGSVYPYTVAVMPEINTGNTPQDLIVSFWGKFNYSSYTGYVEVGVVSDPNDAATFVPYDTVTLANNSWRYHTATVSGFSGGQLALRFTHTCIWCDLTCGIDNLEVRTAAIGSVNLYSIRSTGATLEFSTIGSVGNINLRVINGGDTITHTNITSPFNINGLTPGTTCSYELDYGQCFTSFGQFTTANEALQADWCYGFETDLANNRPTSWTYPCIYGIGSGDHTSGDRGLYLQSYDQSMTAAVLPYIEMASYTGLHFSFMAKGSGYNRTIVGLLQNPLDTAGLFPLDTLDITDNTWRRYVIDLTGQETHGHHLAIIGQSNRCCNTSYTDLDDLRLSFGSIENWSYTATSTSVTIEWTTTSSVDSVQLSLANGQWSTDTTVAASAGSCTIAGLERGTTYSLTITAINSLSVTSCSQSQSTVATLSHDVADGYCEQCNGSWSVLPDGWTYLEDGGRQPWNDGATTRFGGSIRTMALHADSRADAYTMVIAPRATVPLNTLVTGFGAWYNSDEPQQACYLVVGVITDPDDAATFTPIDTVWLSYRLQWFAVDLSSYTGIGQHLAFKGMSLAGYDRNIWLTHVSLNDSLPNDLHVDMLTPNTMRINWQMVGGNSTAKVRLMDSGNIVVDTIAASPFTVEGLNPGTQYTVKLALGDEPPQAPDSSSQLLQPIADYGNLSLNNFTQLQQNGTVSFADGFTKQFLVHHVRRIVVTQIAGSNGYCVLSIDPNDNENDPNDYSITDMFSFCLTSYGWEHSYNTPLYDFSTIGYTGHTYTSRTGNGMTVSCTYSNIGWILEFSQPVCITYGQMNILEENIYYQTAGADAVWSTNPCAERSIKVRTPDNSAVPVCMEMESEDNTQQSDIYLMPYGWRRPYGNQYPRSSTNNYRGGRSLQFYTNNCNSTSDMTSMVVSPYIEGGLAGSWLDMYVLNNSNYNYFIIGTIADPYDTSTFTPHDTLRRYQNWTHLSLDLSAYSGYYLAIRYQTTNCNSGSGYIDNLSIMHCPMPEVWLNNQEDTSVSVNFSGTSPVWIEYSLGSNTSPGNGTRLLATSSPVHLGGLTPASTYTIHVWPQCDTSSFLCNYQTLTHTTMHPPVAIPYCHNFENYSNNGYPDEWARWTPDGTTCAITTSEGHDDSRSLRLIASGQQAPTAILPRLAASSHCSDSLYLNLWARRRSGSPMLLIGTVSDIGDTSSFLPYDTVALTATWRHLTISLPSIVMMGGRPALRLIGGDAVIDNICIEHCVATNATVTDLTQHTATVVWDSHGVDTLICEYGRTGFAQGSGTIIRITASPYTITGLSASSDYQFRFTAICPCNDEPGVVYPNGGGSSGRLWWNGNYYVGGVYVDTSTNTSSSGSGIVVGCSTQAELLHTPYCEDFDTCDVGVMPTGWRGIKGSTSGFPRVTRDMAMSGARCLDLYTTAGYATHAALPPVANPSGLVVTFNAYCTNNDITYRNRGVLTIGVMTDPDRGETFTTLDTIVVDASARWMSYSATISSYVGTDQYIAFRFTPRNSSYHCYIDNLYLGSCAVTSSSATVSAGVVNIAYQTAGNPTGVIVDYGSGQTISHSSPVSLTGLNLSSQQEITLQAYTQADTQALCHQAPIIVNPHITTPYCENFDAVTTRFPDGWQLKHQYSSGTNFSVTRGVLQFEANSNNVAMVLLPPLADGQTLGDLYVDLQYHAYNDNSSNYTYTYLDLGYLTDTTDYTTFITLASIHNSSYLESHTVQLPTTTANRLALRGRSTSGTRRFEIDNLVIYRVPTPKAADITQQSIGYAVRQFSWEASPLLTHYSCEYGRAGYTQGTGTVVTSDSCSLTLTGLEPSADYDIYFIDSESHYTCSPIRFITPTPVAVPYCDRFDTYGSSSSSRPVGWQWNITNSSDYFRCTSSNNYSLYLYSTYYSSESDYITASLPEPYIDSIQQLYLHLRYRYESSVGLVEIGVMNAANDWASFIPVDTLPNGAANIWYDTSISFSRYAGTGRFPAIRFHGYTYQYNYLYIDNLDIQTVPFPHISIQGSTSLAVITDDPAPDYWLEICADGTDQGTGTMHHVLTPHHIIEGLTPNTTYNIYTRPDMLGTTCSSPLTITTPIRLDLPFCEEFTTNGGNNMPAGWRRSDGDVYLTSSYDYSLEFYGYAYNNSANHYAVMPDIDIDSLRHLSITLNYYVCNTPFCIGVMTDPDDYSTFDTIFSHSPVDNYQWYTVTLDLNHYTGNGRFLAISSNHTYGRYDYLYINYLRLQPCPSVNLALSSYNTITATSEAPGYWLRVTNNYGFDSLFHAISNPFHITGLIPETEYSVTVQCDSAVSACQPPVTITTGLLKPLPYCENFDTYGSSSDSYPDGWRKITNCDYDQIHTTSSNNYSLLMYSYYYNQCDMLAVLPDLDIDSIRNASLLMRYRFEQNVCPAEVGILTNPADPSTFTPLHSLGTSLNTWYTDQVNLSQYTGSGRYLAIRMHGNYTYYKYLYIDYLYVQPMPLVNIALTEATTIVARVDSSRRADYWLHYTLAGSGDTSHHHITANTFVLDSLVGNATYMFLTTPDSTVASCWPWTEKHTTYTQQLPYCEDFNQYYDHAIPTGWSRPLTSSDGHPTITGRGSSDTPHLDFAWSGQQMFVTPDLGPVAGIGGQLRMRVGYTSDQLIVGAIADPNDASTFQPVDTLSLTVTGPWCNLSFSLASYTGDAHYIALLYWSSTNNPYYCYVDNLVFESCDAASATMQLVRNNTVRVTASQPGFYVEYGPSGFTQGSGTMVYVDSLPYDITLNYSTTYDLYTRCSDLDVTCRQPLTITTLAQPEELSWCIGFEGMTTGSSPAGWPTLYSPYDYGRWVDVQGTAHGGSRSLRMLSYYDYSNIVCLPESEADSLGGITMSLYARHGYYHSGTLTVGAMASPSDASSFIPVQVIHTTDDWQRHLVDFSGVPSDHHFIAFRNEGPDNEVYIDDIHLAECGAHGLQIVAVESESVTLDWRQTGSPTVSLEVIPSGGTPSVINITSLPPYTLTGLQSLTSYIVRLIVTCGEDDGSNPYCSTDYRDSVRFFTPAGGTGCIDPTNLMADYTTCFTGSYGNPYSSVGLVDSGAASAYSRHTVHCDTTERDPRTGGLLRTVPQGARASVRLGNWNTGTTTPEAEAITYALAVDTMDFDLLIMRYAAVLQDPMHAAADQPRFRLELIDDAGNLIDPTCGAADFIADQALGWNSSTGGVLWKDWTTVGIDLSPYAGQTVYIRLTTYDCNEGSHYGYAYFTLDCRRRNMSSESCGYVASNVFTAPGGFAYRWYTNQSDNTLSTDQSISIASNNEVTYYCQLSFVDNPACSFTMSAYAGTRFPLALMEEHVTMRNCHFEVSFTNLSTISADGVTPVGSGEGTEAAVWEIDGVQSTSYHAQALFDNEGTYDVTLVAMIAGGSCLDTLQRQITLVKPPTNPRIDGPTDRCIDAPADTLVLLEAHMANGSSDTLIVTPMADTTYSFEVVDSNGCHHTVSHTLHVRPTYQQRDTLVICQGQLPYTYGDTTFAIGTTLGERDVRFWRASAYGCDSSNVLQLTLLPTTYGTQYDTTDENTLPHYYHGLPFTENVADSLITITGSNGCDSVVTYSLHIIYYPKRTVVDSTVCSNHLPIMWQGLTLNATDSVTLAARHGEDSVVVLNLTVTPVTYSHLYDTIVENLLPYTWNGVTFNDEGSAIDTLTNVAGCDSIVTMSLTVHPNVGSTADSTICASELPLQWNHRTFTAAGWQMDTLVASTGSDSILTMRLYVMPIYDDTLAVSICDNEQYTFENTTYTLAGNYSHLLNTATYGCDSLRTLNLEVRPTTTGDTVADECDSFTWYGTTYTTSTETPTHLSQNSVQCDSTTTLHLTIRYSTSSTIHETIVENDLPYTFNGMTFSDSVDATVITITNSAGCDSVINYSLSVEWNTGSRLDSNVCLNMLPISWNGETFDTTVANTVIMRTVVIPSSTGSDSTIIMRVHVRPIYNDTIPYSICDNEQHLFEDTTYTLAGNYSHLLHTATYGCDSLRTLNLEVRPTTIGDTIADECDSFTWYGTTYTTSTETPTHLSQNSVQCDSTTTLHLTIRYSTSSTIHETIVENDLPYTFNGVTFSDSVDATVITISNSVGCDSVINYSLSVQWNTGSRLDSNVCLNMLPISWNGENFDTNVANTVITRTVVIQSSTGSDSTIIMRVHVRPIYNDTIPYSICDNEQHLFEGTTYYGTDAGLHSHMLATAIYGCDSLRTINLEVRPTTTGDTIADECDTFTWYGTTYTASTETPTHLSQNSVQCDSTTTLHLTIRYSTTSAIHEHIVENDLPYTFNGVTYTENSFGEDEDNRDTLITDTITITNAVGCDSTINYSLSIDWNTGSRLDSNVCLNMLPISWNGETFDTTVANTVIIHTVVIPSYTGADSTIIMRVHVRPIYNDTIPYSICDNEQHLFEGTIYYGTDAGPHSHMLATAIYGCDSLRTLNLEVRPTTTGDTVADECDTFTWYDTTYTASTETPTHISQNSVQCDSTTTLHLTIRYSTSSVYIDTVIENLLPHTFNGVTFSDSITATTVTIPNTVACDSVITYSLYVHWNVDTTLYDTLCNDALPITWNGQTFDTTLNEQSGTLLRSTVLTAHTGADSTVYMYLTVHPLFDHHQYSEICDNQTLTFGDSTFSGQWSVTNDQWSVTHLDSLLSVHGCDSLSTLHLTVHPTFDHHLYDTVCTNHNYTWGTPQRQMLPLDSIVVHTHATDTLVSQDTAFNTQHFTDSLLSIYGCDSLSSLHLHLLPAYDLHYYDTICDAHIQSFNADSSALWQPHTYPFESTTYNTTGVYPHQLNTHHSSLITCDSTRTLHLQVYPTYDQHLYDTIYDGDLYTFEATVYDTTGVYPHRLAAVYACDSLRTLHLQRNRRTYNDSLLCQNDLPLTWNNVTFSDGMGTRTGNLQVMADSVHLSGLNGIDSLVVMTVTVRDTSFSVDRLHGCDSLRWQDNINYTASTTLPYVILTNAAACDSVVHLALVIDSTHWAIDRHVVCDSMQWIDRQWYYADSLGAIDTIRTVADCDSIVTLDLTVHYSTSTALRDTMCFNQYYNWHGFSVHSDSTYLTEDFPLVDTLYTRYGCDSVVGLILTKMALPRIEFSYSIDCQRKIYRLTATATAPLAPGSTPQPMAYTLWSSAPTDPLLDGQESLPTVSVSPETPTDYILYADYHTTPFCPTTSQIKLQPIVVPMAEMKVNPEALTYDNLDFTAYDISRHPEAERAWYIDWLMQGETGTTLYGTAPIDADSVVVALRVYNGLCYDTAVTILPVHRVAIYAPNAFTPLRDNNNLFTIVGQGIVSGELYIYNREGLLVHHATDYQAGWNGRRDADGRLCPQGNYVWKLIYHATDHTSRTEVGTILLIK